MVPARAGGGLKYSVLDSQVALRDAFEKAFGAVQSRSAADGANAASDAALT